MAFGHSSQIFRQGLAISKWLILSAEASALGSGPQIGIRDAPPLGFDPIWVAYCAWLFLQNVFKYFATPWQFRNG
jgi:hypothetical protein